MEDFAKAVLASIVLIFALAGVIAIVNDTIDVINRPAPEPRGSEGE